MEECEERLSDEQIDELIQVVESKLPDLSGQHSAPSDPHLVSNNLPCASAPVEEMDASIGGDGGEEFMFEGVEGGEMVVEQERVEEELVHGGEEEFEDYDDGDDD